MDITVKEKSLTPGKTAYLRVFGGGPYILIQEGEDMLVKSYEPDPLSKRKNSWKQSTYLVNQTWIVRDKSGNYLQYPAAALTLEKPITKADNIYTGMVVTSCLALVTAPMWILQLASLF